MMLQSSIVLLILGILCLPVQTLRFELKSGQKKCISEEINTDSVSVGKFSIVNPNEGHALPASHKITVMVYSERKLPSPKSTIYHDSEDVESGQFSYTTREAGNHMTCFWAVDHNPEVTLTIDFDWKTGVHAMDLGTVAKKGQVEMMEFEIKKLHDTVASIHNEMFYLRAREEEMQDLNRATNSKMAWLSLLSLVVCLSVAGLQIWHLKTFLEKRKRN